ncbi:GAF domain-containing sensor histidine kinase [Synechococcus moorigangaii CMS01]|nr:GAF domain-containing sensor histidine kinase [Synechococcus moorigangaii CMS01]
MDVAGLYACLDSTMSPEGLLANVTAAIAQGLQLQWVYLQITLDAEEVVSGVWPKTGLAVAANFQVHGDQIGVYSTLVDTPYATLLQEGIQAIAHVPLGSATMAQGDLWVGAAARLPSLATLAALQQPLQLARDLIVQRHQIRCAERHQYYLRELQGCIDQTQDVTSLLQQAIACFQNVSPVEGAAISLLKATHPLSQRHQAPLPQATLEMATAPAHWPHRWQIQDCDFCQAAWHQAPEVWQLTDTATPTQHWRSPLLVGEYRRWLLAPLMGGHPSPSQGRIVLGFVILGGRSPRPWHPTEQQTLALMAHQLSQTLIHRRALQQVQSLVEERTSQLKWSLEVQAKLSQTMRQQIQQLRQLNRLKDDFLSTISHELNTPLATMKLAVNMLKQPGRSPEKQRTYLDILDQELTRESKLIHDLLQLQQAEASEFALKLQRLTLGPALETLIQKARDRWSPLKQLQFQLTFLPEAIAPKLQIETDPEHFLNIISELLTNAGKYAAPQSTITLQVQPLGRSPAQIQIRICNDGLGIAPEEQAQIFEKFRRGTGATAQAIPGTGLGLALAKTIIEHLGGSITVSSEPNLDRDDYRTCFVLSFPQTLADA